MADREEADVIGQGLAQVAHIDDYITLFCDDGPGFVYAEVTSDSHAQWTVARQQDKGIQNANLTNIHAATFQIFGPTKYKSTKKLTKLLQGPLKGKTPEDYTTSEHEELARERKNVTAEVAENKQERDRQSGKPIVYGQVVQLQHALSKRFLAVSTTRTSDLEAANMQLDLAPTSSRKCQFRVLPRYKVRAVGDPVRVGDQIQLESVKTEGQFLHCSNNSFAAHHVQAKSRELNLSATQSALKLLHHFSPLGKAKVQNMLRGGSAIRLFHRELEAYLTAVGASYKEEPVQDVHLRVRPQVQDRPRSLEPPSSGITYWQVELDENPTSGDPISWGQRVRLKHMGTQKYLSIIETDANCYELALTTCETKTEQLEAAFRLHPVIQEDGTIKLGSYCRIDNPRSKQWLHALSDQEPGHIFERKEEQVGSGGDVSSLSGLQWDKAILRRIHVSRTMNYNDAFTLQEVIPDLVDSFNFVAGMLPVFHRFLINLRNKVMLDAKSSDKMKKALRQLAEFQEVNGEPCKDHQKLLRNLLVVDILVEVLMCHGQPFVVQTPNKDYLTSVCHEIYACLETYLLGDSRKNELYTAKFIPFFQSQIGKGLNAETMAMELARDNRDIIDRLPRSQIDQFVSMLLKKKDGRYLDFLGVLCVCDGIAIPDNQEYICKKLLEEHKEGSGVVYLTDPTPDKKSMTISVDNGRTRMPLGKFAKEGGAGPGYSYEFLEYQLDLFGKLCYGRNEYVIDVITEKLRYLTWDEVFICLKDSSLPNDLRAKYCQLIIGMFVDVSPNYSALDTLELSFIFEKVRKDPAGDDIQVEDESITGAKMHFFPDLRKWIAKYLESTKGRMVAANIGDNELLGEVFCLLKYLVGFGYYSAGKDIEELLTPLLGVLDGSNDYPFDKADRKPLKQFQAKGRFEQNKENKAIVDAKYRAMEVLDVFFNFGFNVRLEALIYEYKSTVEKMAESGGGEMAHVAAFQHVQGRLKGGFSSVRMRGTIEPDLSGVRKQKYDMEGADSGPPDIISVLMNKVNDEDILGSEAIGYARHRLREHVFKKVKLFKGRGLEKILQDLGNYKYDKMVVKSVYLLDRFYSTHAMLFQKAIQAQVLITPSSINVFKRVRELVPELRRLTASKLTHEMEMRMIEIIDIFTGFCSIRLRSDQRTPTEEPHAMNQNILVNFGVVDDIFNILDKRIDMEFIDTQYAGLRIIFRKSFTFLQVMARSNAVVQTKVFERMDKLLDIPGCPQELGLCLAEVFTGNMEICVSIKAYQVKRIVELVAKLREEGAELLVALNAIVKVEELDLPLKRNQAAVMNFINQNRARVAWILQPQMLKERLALLHDGREDNTMLTYLVNLVDVLATCAEGENRFIESMCQKIFELNEILEVLNDRAIPVWCKRPYVRFFVWCYLNTAGGPIESGSDVLDHDDRMWRFLTTVQDDLQALCEGFGTFSRKRAADLRETLKRRRTVNSKSDALRQKPAVDRTSLSTPGILPYLVDGILPMLQVFFRQYYDQDKPVGQEMRISSSIGTHLLNMYESLIAIVSNINSYNAVKTTIATIVTIDNVSVPDEALRKFQQDAFKVNPDIRSDAAKEYEEDYFDEELLNTRLNQFVANFHTAYEGRNTIHAQIHEPYDTEYCEDGGDEDLPRGQEFQRFLRLFQDGEGIVDHEVAKLVNVLDITFHRPEYRSVSSVEREALDILNVKCLQLLRALIHNKIVVRAAIAEHGGADAAVERYEKMISGIQVAIDSHNTTVKVVPLLSHHSNEVVRETLAFLSVMLFNAQRAVQNSFVDYCLGTREEQFFRDIGLRLYRSAIALKERRALRSQFQSKLAKDKDLAETVRSKPTARKTQTKSRRMSQAALASNEMEMREIERKEAETEDTSRQTAEDSVATGKDDGYIELVLRILASLCDGQQRTIQNYLRDQPDNIKSVNLVAETVNYLHLFKDDVKVDNLGLVIQILQTLVEFTSGNTENQACVFDSKVIEAINSIMQTRWASPSMRVEVMGVISDLLRNLVELSVPATKTLAKLVLDTVRMPSLFACMSDIYENRLECGDGSGSEADVVGYRIMHFVKRLNDFAEKDKKWEKMPDFAKHSNTKEEQVAWTAAWQHYEKSTLSIEVMHDGHLQRVYFAAEFKDDLRPEVKEQLKWNIDRDSPANKLRDFLKWSEDIREDMEYQGQLSRNRVTRFFVKNSEVWRIGLLLLTFCLNIFVLATWRAPTYLYDKSPDVGSYYDYVIYAAGSIHLLFSLFVAITFFIANLKNFTIPWVVNWVVHKFTSHNFNGDDDIERHNELSIIGLGSLYHVCLVGFSAAAIAFKGYFFCFHLLHIIVNNDILTRVLQSVTRPGRQLIYVAILSLFIIYIYAVASFAVLRVFFDRNDGLFCETLGQCYATSIRHGLLATLGDVIPVHVHTFREVGIRIILDLSFFIIITTIGLNIVFGLIVDSFSALRDEKNDALEDMSSLCFMCSKPSHEFDKYGQGFEYHVKHDHNMWAYLFYFIYLHQLEQNEMTSTEYFIFRKMKAQDLDFFPTNKALCLESIESGNEEQLDQLMEMVGRLVQRIEREEEDEKRQKARQEQKQWEEIARKDATDGDGRRVSSLSTAAFSMLKSKRKSDAAPRVPDMPEDVSLDGSDAGSGGSAD